MQGTMYLCTVYTHLPTTYMVPQLRISFETVTAYDTNDLL